MHRWLPVLLLPLSLSAPAAVIRFNPPDLTMGTTQGLCVDLDDSGAGGVLAGLITTSCFAGTDFSFDFDHGNNGEYPGVFGYAANSAVASTGGFAEPLLLGQPIGPGAVWQHVAYLEQANVGPWQGPARTGYLGVQMDVGGGNYQYGWIQIRYDDPNQTITLLDFAYESTLNLPILAGSTQSVPAAAPVAMAAMGLGLLLLLRRRSCRESGRLALSQVPLAMPSESLVACERVSEVASVFGPNRISG